MIRPPPRSTLFPYRRSSDLQLHDHRAHQARLIGDGAREAAAAMAEDRKSTRLNSSHLGISYAVFCLKKKKHQRTVRATTRKTHTTAQRRRARSTTPSNTPYP